MIDSRTEGRPLRILLTSAALALAVTGSATARQPAAGVDQPLEIPRPDLSAMEEVARRKIESMQTSLVEFVQRDDILPQELAEGFGYLGQLFHAYRLLDPLGIHSQRRVASSRRKGILPRARRFAGL